MIAHQNSRHHLRCMAVPTSKTGMPGHGCVTRRITCPLCWWEHVPLRYSSLMAHVMLLHAVHCPGTEVVEKYSSTWQILHPCST